MWTFQRAITREGAAERCAQSQGIHRLQVLPPPPPPDTSSPATASKSRLNLFFFLQKKNTLRRFTFKHRWFLFFTFIFFYLFHASLDANGKWIKPYKYISVSEALHAAKGESCRERSMLFKKKILIFSATISQRSSEL